MATKRFEADAPAIKQVDVRTVGGTPGAGNTLVVTSALGAVYTYTLVAGDTTNTIAAASFVADFQQNAGAISAEFNDVSVSSSGALVSFTENTAGKPFTFTYSGGTSTFASSSTVANSGPSVYDVAANWGGSNPSTTDTVIFDQGEIPCLWRLDQNASLSGTLSIYSTFEADIGLGPIDDGGYPQYRERYLTGAWTVVNIGSGDGRGQPRCWLNLTATNLKVNVWNTGRGADNGYEALQIKGSGTFDVINIVNGEMGLAVLGGDTVTCTLLNVGGPNASPRVRGGLGCAVTGLVQQGGTVILENAPSGTATILGGTANFVRGGNITTLKIDKNSICYLGGNGSAMTVTNCSVGENAVYDLSQGNGAVTHTNPIYVDAGGTIVDPYGRLVTGTDIITRGCTLSEIAMETGIDGTWRKQA